MLDVFAMLVAVLVVGSPIFAWIGWKRYRDSRMTPAERAARSLASESAHREQAWGPINERLVCPHCQSRGGVRTKLVQKKAGISGGKATAAILTAGVSMLATGLSRKETVTSARCDTCSSAWDF